MSKFIFSVLLAFITVFSVSAASAGKNCGNYRDVKDSDWYCPMLLNLQTKKILDDTKKEFKPTQSINRAEALKMIVEAAGQAKGVYANDLFEIKNSEWYSPYFHFAYANKMIQAEKLKLNPSKTVSKAEFLLLLVRSSQVWENYDTEIGECYTKMRKIVLSEFVGGNTDQNIRYLCAAEQMQMADRFDEAVLNRATAMAILYKAFTN